MSRSARVVVVGAGIGGLTAACALRRHGLEVEVLERSSELGEVGAGLQIGPNGVRVLRALGLDRALEKAVCEPDAIVSVDGQSGVVRYREPVRDVSARRFGAPYLTAHRADVHQALQAALPAGTVRPGATCTGAESLPGGAVATLDGGAQVEADVVVGADGIRSAVRESQFGADEPRFTGQICWRGIVPISCVPAPARPHDLAGWIAPSGHVICYPIRGGELYNIFAGHVSSTWIEESWTVPSSRDELLAAYAEWHPALRAMLGRIEHCFKWGIHDRDPLPRWTAGRVTLLGDAAHPMMPTLAQGASIAMEDGFALARHLAAGPGDPAAALAAYDAERVPRASQVQLQARTQFENNQRTPAPPPLDRSWIFAHDATYTSSPMRNRLRELLVAEPSVLGVFSTLRDPAVTELAALAGFDFVLIETEHAALSLETMEDHLRAARAHGIGTLVRVPSGEPKGILRVLDAGADGVLVPHVGSADAARSAVEAVRYPPAGHRGMYGGSRAADYGAHGLGAREAADRMNRDTVLAVMVEDASGVDELEAIAAVPGLDMIHIGPSDLSASLGRVGEREQPEIAAAVERLRAACAANGIKWGFPVGNGAYPLTAAELRDLGAFMLTAGSEAGHLLEAFRATVSRAQGAPRPA